MADAKGSEVTDRSHYVDLRAALRVVVEMLPGGETLAPQLTDELIRRGVGLFASEGSDLLKLYRAALPVLADAIKSPSVELLVVAAPRDGERPEDPRPILKSERDDYRLELREALLAPPFGQSQSMFRPLIHVVVSTEGLRRHVGQQPPDLEALLRQAIAANPKLTGKQAGEIARAAKSTASREVIRAMLKRLGGSDKTGPKGPRENRAARPA